jgi:predicted component of type VI protein secretion system
MRYQAIRIHAQSERTRDREWVMLVTEFLGMYTSDLSRELLTQAAEMKAYLSVLADQLRAAASKLESGLLQGYHCRCELINPLRCADRGSSCTHN